MKSQMTGDENDILKSLRQYARFGKGEYWQYSQRRIYSEGDIVSNDNDSIFYERLHEMKLFTKEYDRLPNDNVSAEIYFVLAISGIEYAICISNPDISEYQKSIEDHNGESPLTSNDERHHYSLSNINPILIKSDNKFLK